MSFTSINLTEAVSAAELPAYGAKPGQHDCFPGGIAVFAKNTSSSAVSAGTVYITPAGALAAASSAGYLTGTTLADCPAGAGIYAVVEGLVPASSPVFVEYTVVA